MLKSGQVWAKQLYKAETGTADRRTILAIVNCYPFAGVRIIYGTGAPRFGEMAEHLTTPADFRRWMIGARRLHQRASKEFRRPAYYSKGDGCEVDP